MLVRFRRIALSYAMGALGVLLAGLSPWWLTPLLHDSPPMRVLLVVTVTATAWVGGLWPGLFATALGMFAIAVTNDMPGNMAELSNRLLRFGLLSVLISLMMHAVQTSRRRAISRELSWRRSEGRYRRLVETAGEGIWVIDRGGRTTYANPRLGEMLGVETACLVGQRLEDFLVDPLDLVGSGSLASPPAWHELRLQSGDGQIKNARRSARPIGADDLPGDVPELADEGDAGWLLMVTDISALKRTEEALRAERDFSSAVLETAGCLVMVLDCDGRIVRFNRVCREVTGVTEEGVIGRPLEELFTTADEAMATRRHFEKVMGGAGPSIFESRWNTKTRGFRRIAWNHTTLLDQHKRISFIIATGTDITELRRAEEALREAKEIAEAASHAKDRFLAVLSHELRTPLTPALIAVSALLESKLTPMLRTSLEMVHRNIELEARLIDDLLDLSRIARGQLRLELEVVDLHLTIRRAVEICRNDSLVSGVIVMTELAAERYHVIADHARLLQIVWNLIRNAVKFTPTGGRLSIATKSETFLHRTDQPDKNTQEWDGCVVVEFTDTGIGIEASMLPRIFNAFEQSRDDLRARSGGGLGLGLAISRSLAEALGGQLTVTSDGLGMGSTFRLVMATVDKPVKAREPANDDDNGARASAERDRPLRIMLLEDNEDTLRFLAIILRQRGHVVVTAERVAEAHAKVADADAPFDLLISDIELPDGSGLHLMCELGKGANLPGIAISGFGTEEDVRLSREAGFFEHLTKPVDVNRLDAAIRRVSVSRRPDQLDEKQSIAPAEDHAEESIIANPLGEIARIAES